MFKICTACNKELPLIDFHLDKKSKDGRYTICKTCKNIRINYAKLLRVQQNDYINVLYKTCSSCNTTKDISQFSIKSSSKDNHDYTCKSCNIEAYNVRKDKIISNNTYHKNVLNKVCTVCKTIKHINDFGYNRLNKDGHDTMCKSCKKKYEDSRRYNDIIKQNIEKTGIKSCTRCKQNKPLHEFNRNIKSINGYASHCKKCNQDTYDKIKEIKNKLARTKYKKDMIELTNNILLQTDNENKNTILYILLFTDIKGASFYKIGVTSRSIKIRYISKKYKDYTYKVIHESYHSQKRAYNLEYMLLEKHKQYKYSFPDYITTRFDGYTECLYKIDIDILYEYIK